MPLVPPMNFFNLKKKNSCPLKYLFFCIFMNIVDSTMLTRATADDVLEIA